MKKIIITLTLILFFILLAALALKFYFSQKNIVHISDAQKENAPLFSNSVSNANMGGDNKKNQAKISAGKVVESPENNFELYDRMEKKWLNLVLNIVGSKTYPLYLEMRERNDQEKMRAYKEYHDYLRLKYGDKYSYHISEDQSIREKKINEHYMNELLKLIGEEKFKTYLKAKDNFNEESRRQSKEAMIIEF